MRRSFEAARKSAGRGAAAFNNNLAYADSVIHVTSAQASRPLDDGSGS